MNRIDRLKQALGITDEAFSTYDKKIGRITADFKETIAAKTAQEIKSLQSSLEPIISSFESLKQEVATKERAIAKNATVNNDEIDRLREGQNHTLQALGKVSSLEKGLNEISTKITSLESTHSKEISQFQEKVTTAQKDIKSFISTLNKDLSVNDGELLTRLNQESARINGLAESLSVLKIEVGNKGGGNMNRQFSLNSSVIGTKFTDINIISTGATATANATTKKTDLTIIPGASGITGTGIANQVTYWTAPTVIGGNANWTINPATNSLILNDLSANNIFRATPGTGISQGLYYFGDTAGAYGGSYLKITDNTGNESVYLNSKLSAGLILYSGNASPSPVYSYSLVVDSQNTEIYGIYNGDRAFNISSSSNTWFGKNTGTNITSGAQNTFFGTGAGLNVSTASNVTLIGYFAGTLNTGSNNTIVGAGAFVTNVSGSFNVALGDGALSASTSSYNTALGTSAGTVITSGQANTCLGYSASPLTGTFNSTITIGANAFATASNQLVIGGNSFGITDAYIGNAVTNSAPAGFTLNATGGSGNNIAGASLTIAGGKGTGTGTPGNVVIKVSTVGVSGSTLQSLATIATFSSTGLALGSLAVTTGVWNGSVISEAYGGTNQSTYAKGDIIHATAANTLGKLTIGVDTSYMLRASSGDVAWVRGVATLLTASWNNNIATGVTTYGGFNTNATFSTETARNATLKACTAQDFYVTTTSGQGAGGSLVLTVRKTTAGTSASTNIVITIAAGSAAGVYSDTAHTQAYIDGDSIAVQVVNNHSGNSANMLGAALYCYV